jgi:hypothetical protein
MSDPLGELLSLRDATLADLQARLGPGEVDDDDAYGQMDGLTSFYAPASHPAVFYLRDDRLVVGQLAEPDEDGARALVGPDAPRLRSIAGKRAWVHVGAPEGVAVTELDGDVLYVEVFPPTTFEDYRDRIHTPPPHFIE